MATPTTHYRIRLTPKDGGSYIHTYSPSSPYHSGFFSWTGRPSLAHTFPSRESATTAALDIEAMIEARCGYRLTLKIVPASGGAPITRTRESFRRPDRDGYWGEEPDPCEPTSTQSTRAKSSTE